MDINKGAAWGTPGGKKLLGGRIVALLPDHKTYTETFIGAGTVFLKKEPADVEVINDLDSEVAFAWETIKGMPDADMRRLEKMDWRGSKTTWDRLLSASPSGKLARLYRFLYLTRFAYGRMRGKSFNHSDAGVIAKICPKVDKIRPRLKGVVVMSGDYQAAAKKYDGKNTVHFFDPPYPGYNAFNGQGSDEGVGEKEFDEDRFYSFIKGLNGRVIVTTGVRGRLKWPGFHVHRISSGRSIGHMRRVGGSKMLDQLLITNFRITQKSFGDGIIIVPLSKGFPNSRADGGIHVHALRRAENKTANDGMHRHVFKGPDGTVYVTAEDGAHEHDIDRGYVYGGAHAHKVSVTDSAGNTQVLATNHACSEHYHYSQAQYTGFDGAHTHTLQLPDATVLTSLTGEELFELEGGSGEIPNAPPASALAQVAKTGHINLDFGEARIGTVSLAADGDVYVDAMAPESAALAVLDKSALLGSRLISGAPASDSMALAEVVLRPCAATLLPGKAAGDVVVVGEQALLIDDAGHEIAHAPSVAVAQKGQELLGSLRSDSLAPAVLSWPSVRDGIMPPSGLSALPKAMAAQVPEHLQYWLMAGEQALRARDALFDSGFADHVLLVGGEAVACAVSVRPIAPADIGSVAPLSLDDVFKCLGLKRWRSLDLPIESVFLDLAVMKEWKEPEAVMAKLEAHEGGFVAAAPDTIATRVLFERLGGAAVVRRSAARDLVFATNMPAFVEMPFVEHLAGLPLDLAFANTTDFSVAKTEGKLWLTIGDRSFCVQKDWDTKGGCAVESPRPDDAVILEKGRVRETDDGIFCHFHFSGDTVSGGYSIRDSGDGVWKISKDDGRPTSMNLLDIVKQKAEKRYILGVVMEPEEYDAHADITSHDEIESACFDWMIRSQQLNFMHRRKAPELHLVENYLAPHKLMIKGKTIKTGTWLQGMLVQSDRLWARVKSGELDGLSIGGAAYRKPI